MRHPNPRPFPVLALLTLLLSLPALPAQDAATAELELAVHATAAFTAHAQTLEGARMYGRALDARKELLMEYAEDDPLAREKCGFVKVGSLWRRDQNALVLTRDGGNDQKLLRKIEQEWERTMKDLARRHEAVAHLWARQNDQGRAARHWRRVLRFKPGDKEAVAQLQLEPFEGFLGSERELQILRRSRAIRDGVRFLAAWEPHVEELTGKLPLAERAGVAAVGLRTRHFEYWGNIPAADLRAAILWAERTRLLAHAVFDGVGGERWVPRKTLTALFVPDKVAYHRLLDACSAQFDADRLQFMKEQVQLTFLKDGKDEIRAHLVLSQAETLDQTVRGVVQDMLGIETHGLWEGIGHAFCGFAFGQTLTFLVEQQKAITVTAWKPRPLLPDMKVWMEIAAETAWSKADTSSARLALLHAARFTNEERVKAWATVDWLCRWRPDLVLELDRSRTPAMRLPEEVERAFQQRTGMDLQALDADWRDYWARGEALRAAILADTRGDKDAVQAAVALCDAVNRERAAANVGPLGCHVADGPAVQAAERWFEAMARAAAERKKAKPGVEVRDPDAPGTHNRDVLSLPGKDPAAAVARWMPMPGARDVLLHPGRSLIGGGKGRHGVHLDLREVAVPLRSGPPVCWPGDLQSEVPGLVRAGDLGPQLAAVLFENGITADREVGMPVSLHFFRTLDPVFVRQVVCRVSVDGRGVDGVPMCIQGEGDRTQAAEGCCVFVPRDPLPKGAVVTVEWTLPQGVLPDGAVVVKARFRVAG